MVGRQNHLDNYKDHKSANFISFFEELLVKRYLSKWVVLVIDNAAYHKGASALAVLSWFEHRVMIFRLPPYYSDLNPTELF